MPRVERVPGRRKAAPARLERAPELPARARAPLAGTRTAGDEQPPPPHQGARATTLLGTLWLAALAASVAGLVVFRYVEAIEVDAWVEQSVAAASGVLLALGLAVRSGARPWPAAALAAIVGVSAVATQWPALLGGAAVGTGVLAACLAVLGTTPAPSFRWAVLEVIVAEVLATVGAFGVAGFRIDVEPARFRYTVLALSMAAVVTLVYRLGGGLHGLGRSGALLVLAGLALLVVGLAYTAALTRWGSPEFRLDVESARLWMRDHLGGAPHPIEVFLGVPALAWGVTMRDRRRQGWWVCAFGATATATATTRLLAYDASALHTALGAAYSIVLGLMVGYVVIQLVRLLRGKPGRRVSRTAEVSHRREPARLRPLH